MQFVFTFCRRQKLKHIIICVAIIDVGDDRFALDRLSNKGQAR